MNRPDLAQKIDPLLLQILEQDPPEKVPIEVIVQTTDGLKGEDRRMVENLGGKIKADLHIVNSYSADLTPSQIEAVAMSARVVRIYYDAPVKAF